MESGHRHFEGPGICERIREVARELLEVYKAIDLTDRQISALQLALDEAVTNAVHHGHKDDTSRIVTVDCSWDAESVKLKVADQGDGFPTSGVPDPTLCCNLMKECGRGLYIIHSIMQDVKFNEKGNEISMTLSRKDC